MDDLLLRILVVSVIGAAAVSGAWVSRRGRSLRRRTFEPRGIEPGLHLFTSASCPSCQRARSVLAESAIPYEEHAYEQSDELLRRNRIERVPSLVYVPAGDGESWLAEGVPSSRALDRWFGT